MKFDYFSEQKDKVQIVWPALPEVPRYRYAGLLLGETNFSTEQTADSSSVTKFMHWLVGLDSGAQDPNQLDRPQSGIVLDGRIYVTDIGKRAVFVFDERDPRLHSWNMADQDNEFIAPVGIVAESAERILVADAELGRVVRLDNKGNPLGSFGQKQLQRPTGLARDPDTGLIYVADTAAHNIKVFKPNGSLHRVIGKRGIARGEFNGPTHLAFARKTLVVSDTLNARVQLLSPDGESIKVVGRRGLYVGNLTRPKGVALDDDGNLYIVEGYYDHLLVFNDKGELLLPIGGTGLEIGHFFLPSGMWIDQNNRIFVADMFNSRVVMFQYLGR
jgi:DNA-binding beta-propeller fold protein YncE